MHTTAPDGDVAEAAQVVDIPGFEQAANATDLDIDGAAGA